MSVRHTCGGSDGCMCFYDPALNDELVVGPTLVPLGDVIKALEDYFAPQVHRSMHPADFVTKRFHAEGHEGLEYA